MEDDLTLESVILADDDDTKSEKSGSASGPTTPVVPRKLKAEYRKSVNRNFIF
jgi:hypothetical protein